MSSPASSEILNDKHVAHHEEHSDVPPKEYEGSIQDPDLEPDIGFKAFMVIVSCALSYLALVYVLVAMGLQGTNIVAAVGGAKSSVWIQNGSTLVSVVIAPPLSRISDFVGRKWIVVTCGAIGALGAALIGGATSMGMAISGGVLAGFLVAMQGPYSAICSEVTPRRYRSLAQGLLNIGPTVGGILGASAGQKISTHADFAGSAGWRATFYFGSGIAAFSVLMLIIFYHPAPTPNPENRSYTARWLDFDLGGTAILTAAITPLTIGLTWGGGAYPWKSAHAIVPTVVGAVLLVVFGLHQTYIKKDGLFHHQQFKNRNFALSITAQFVEGIFYYVYNAYIGEQCAILYDSRPVQFGLFFCAFFLPQLIMYPLCGWIVKQTRDAKTPLIAGYVLFVVLMIGLAQAGPDLHSRDGVIVVSVFAGIAFVPAETLLQTVGQLAVPPELIGTSAALAAAVRSFGGVIGVAIATSIFNSKVAINIPKYVAPAALKAGLPASSLVAFITALAAGDTAALSAVVGVTPEIIGAGAAALKEGFAKSFSYIWYFEIPFMVLALISVSVLASTKEQMNWIINRPVEAIHHKHHQHAGHHDSVPQEKVQVA